MSLPPDRASTFAFPPFRLDLRAGQLFRDETPVPLRPKTFAVLQHLVEHRGELVTKDALLAAVWGGVAVSEEVIRISVAELRAALGDERTAPRFIETAPRRGYRFIARSDSTGACLPESRAPMTGPPQAEGAVVGRVRERSLIDEWLRAARDGRRRVAFISGEAGIGKTTLVDAALRELQRSSGTEYRIARGQCVEQFGGGEPYLPVVEALAVLCHGSDGKTARASLREHAPDWLLDALGPAAFGSGNESAPAITHEQTLHKLAATLDALATEIPLVVVLEDVQWSDYATLDLLSILAQRREPARLLVLCTLRPADAIAHGHPIVNVKRELVRKGVCPEVSLDGLSASDVAAYLGARLGGADLPQDLLRLFVDRTEGNPFFVVTLADHLLEHGLLVRSDERWQLQGKDVDLRTAIPDGLRAVIEPRLERLSTDELRVLEMASVVGSEFPAHAVAQIAPRDGDLGDVEYVEQLCDGLVRRQVVLRAAGESTWPDGIASACYAFRHALYQQVVYQRISSSTCRRRHQTVGENLEAAFDGRTMDIASQLAAHFERSRDVERAIRYHGEAAAHAGSRFASQEARLHLQAALDLLGTRPESEENLQREMSLLNQLGWTLTTINGWGDSNAASAFTRMSALAERLDIPLMRLQAMEALRSVHVMRAEYATTRDLCEDTMALAEHLGDASATGTAHVDLGSALIHLGDVEGAHHHAEQGRSRLDGGSIHGIAARVLLASTSAYLGWVPRSRAMADEAIARAEATGIPYFMAFASTFSAGAAQHLRDLGRTRVLATEALRVSSQCGFAEHRVKASMDLGWCAVEEGRANEGRTLMLAGFRDFTASGERTSTTHWLSLLAGAHLACGDVESANDVLETAFRFVEETGERLYEPELHRLKGECLFTSTTSRNRTDRAVECLERAIAIAAERKTVVVELRAATSLLRFRGKAVRDRVDRLLERFEAENDCADARIARALLR